MINLEQRHVCCDPFSDIPTVKYFWWGGKRPGGQKAWGTKGRGAKGGGAKDLGGKRSGGKRPGGQKVRGQKTVGQKTRGQKTGGKKSCYPILYVSRLRQSNILSFTLSLNTQVYDDQNV